MEEFLSNIEYVTNKSKHVSINKVKILDFCKSFECTHIKHWLYETPFSISKLSNNDKLNFLLVFNSLSFSYWGEPKWKVRYREKIFDGSFGMIAAIGRAVDNKKPILFPRYMVNLTKKDFESILKGTCRIPLFEERWKNVKEVGEILMKKYNGEFKNLVNEAKGDAVKLVKLIVKNLPNFNDVSIYKDKKIYFYKRAQLLVADIYQLFRGKSYGGLKNIDKLTACADYKLPQMLRNFGILSYSLELSKKVDNKREIEQGSKEEVEIRANTIWAVELIKKELEKKIPEINSLHINDYLWLLSQDKSFKCKPYHLVRTTFY